MNETSTHIPRKKAAKLTGSEVRQGIAVDAARNILQDAPADLTDLQQSIVISLGLGLTGSNVALTTGAAKEYIYRVGRKYRKQVDAIAVRRAGVLAGLAEGAVYQALALGLAALSALSATQRPGKSGRVPVKDRLTPSNIASVATSAQAFCMIAEKMHGIDNAPLTPMGEKPREVFRHGFHALGNLVAKAEQSDPTVTKPAAKRAGPGRFTGTQPAQVAQECARDGAGYNV